MLAAFSETTDSTGRMACTQDGNSTGASASPSSTVGLAVSCGDASDAPGSGRESQSGISIESRESTSWFERDAESLAGEKRLESIVAGAGVSEGRSGSSSPGGDSCEGSSQSKRFSAGGWYLSRN